MDKLKEIWITTNNHNKQYNTIIAISNKGRIMRRNGVIEYSHYMQEFKVKGIRTLIHRFIANNFIPKTEDDIIKQRKYIDHITHEPKDMCINDIRNMRWCTHKENCNFEECVRKKSEALKGKPGHRKGKKASLETRQKQSKARLGKAPWNKGKHGYHTKGYIMSEETKLKHSKAMLGKFKNKHWHIENGKRVWV